MNSFFEDNQRLWDDKVDYHIQSPFYDLEGFKQHKNSLKKIELNALKEFRGKSVLHLQCHFGMDSLSMANLGARVTGVDFSTKAIDIARELSTELNIPARFIQANIYALKNQLREKFDIVFCSYGILCWLPDLDQWAEIIAHFLKPGGIFFIVDTHPYFFTLDHDSLKISYPYFNPGEPITMVTEGTYADRKAPIKNTTHEWSHSLSEILMKLMQNGLEIIDFQEYPYEMYGWFPGAYQDQEGRWFLKGLDHMIPLLFSIKARKK